MQSSSTPLAFKNKHGLLFGPEFELGASFYGLPGPRKIGSGGWLAATVKSPLIAVLVRP